MTTEDWEAHLADEPPFAPRPDFATRVLSAVARERLAGAPPAPIPFPWRRAAAGLAALAAIVVAGSALALSEPLPVAALREAATSTRVLWLAGATAASVATIVAALSSLGRTAEEGVDGLSV